MNVRLLDASEWDALQEAMLFCLAIERERIPTKERELRWIEFRQYVIDRDGDLTHESRLVSVTETRTKPTTKRRRKTLFVGTGGTIEETIWDLIEQVAKEIQVRRERYGLMPNQKKQSVIVSVRSRGFLSFAIPKGSMVCLSHGRGCVCERCQAEFGRVPN